MAVPSPSKNLSSPSPSSGASVSRPGNPNLRNSEAVDPKRRSFVGSPFPKPSVNTGQRGGGFHPNTPANSPSDYRPRRHSIGKENTSMNIRENHERENGIEQSRISGKGQPAATSRGCKNFMSPTISAASKVNASPKKKILAEKDDPIRTSISLSCEKLPYMRGFDAKPDKCLNHKKEVSFDSTVTYLGDEEEAFQCDDDLASKVGSSSSDNDICSLETEIEEKDLGFDAKLDKCLDHKKEVSFDLTVTYLGDEEEAFQCDDDLVSKVGSSSSDNDICSLETEIEEKDLVNLDPSFKISPGHEDPSPLPTCFSSGDAMPPLSPLDADPHMAPYDPKTNYLSPRPRFLHYKHNPRVELYLQLGSNGNLKESFLAEGLANVEVTEDEVSSDVSQMESDDASSDIASNGLVEKEDEEEVEVAVAEPDPSSECKAETEIAEAKEMHRGRSITRTKFVVLLLLLASVGLYVSFFNTPVMDPSVLNNLNLPELYVPPELSRVTRESFEQVTQSFQLLLHRCLSYLQSLVLGFNKKHNLVTLEYANLTTLLEDNVIDEARAFSSGVFQKAAKFENYESWPLTDGDATLASVFDLSEHTETTGIDEVTEAGSHDQEIEDQDKTEAPCSLDFTAENAPVEDDEETDFSTLVDNSALEEVQQDNSEHEISDMPARIEARLSDESATPTLETAEDRIEMVNEFQSHRDVEESQPMIPQSAEAPQEGALDATQTQSAAIHDQQMENCHGSGTAEVASEDEYQTSIVSFHYAAGILALLLVGLLAAQALFFRKSSKLVSTNDNATLAIQKAIQTAEQKDSRIVSSPTEQDSQLILSSNWVTEVEYSGEDTCTSEMSGFQSTASRYQKGMKIGTSQEARSHERRGPRSYSRRESSASSGYSVGSQSYGSFTTYEKLPTKHKGDAEDEAVMITPVRRSSRLRSKVSSPEQAT